MGKAKRRRVFLLRAPQRISNQRVAHRGAMAIPILARTGAKHRPHTGKGKSIPFLQELPIQIPTAKTSTPPTTT
jgi:hypothetical protein